MGEPNPAVSPLKPLGDNELSQWEDAYVAVEAYLSSLRVKNRLLSAEMVRGILWRASERHKAEPDQSARVLAMEEAMREIAQWTQKVLHEPLEHNRLAARGRLALLLADMPGKWQPVFLTPQPWPETFIEGMRKSYLAAGPQFAELTMAPQSLEFNALGTGAASWWETMDRRPVVRKMVALFIVVLIAAALWSIFYKS